MHPSCSFDPMFSKTCRHFLYEGPSSSLERIQGKQEVLAGFMAHAHFHGASGSVIDVSLGLCLAPLLHSPQAPNG